MGGGGVGDAGAFTGGCGGGRGRGGFCSGGGGGGFDSGRGGGAGGERTGPLDAVRAERDRVVLRVVLPSGLGARECRALIVVWVSVTVRAEKNMSHGRDWKQRREDVPALFQEFESGEDLVAPYRVVIVA